MSTSKTDWDKVREACDSNATIPYDGPEDGPYDPNDYAALARFFEQAISRGPIQRANGTGRIRIDLADFVLEYFTSQGDDWHERINEVLKQYVQRQELTKAS